MFVSVTVLFPTPSTGNFPALSFVRLAVLSAFSTSIVSLSIQITAPLVTPASTIMFPSGVFSFSTLMPTAVPLVYEFDDDMNVTGKRYLGDQDAIAAKAKAVSEQAKKKA